MFGDGLTLSDCTITYADGTPLGADELTLMVTSWIEQTAKSRMFLYISTKTSYFDPEIVFRIRAEVASYKFKIQKKGNNNIMELN